MADETIRSEHRGGTGAGRPIGEDEADDFAEDVAVARGEGTVAHDPGAVNPAGGGTGVGDLAGGTGIGCDDGGNDAGEMPGGAGPTGADGR